VQRGAYLKNQNNSGEVIDRHDNELTELNLNYDDRDKSASPSNNISQNYDDVNEFHELAHFDANIKKENFENDIFSKP
jgi:hypothetical protein